MRHDFPDITFGRKHQPVGYVFSTSCYDKFQIIAVINGALCYETPETEKTLGPGSIAVLRPGGAFRLRCPDKDYSGIFVHSANITTPGFEGPCFAGKPPGSVSRVISKLINELHSNSPWADRIAQTLAEEMVWQAMRWLEPDGPSSEQADGYARYWARQARHAIDTSLYTDLSTRQALAHLRFSYRQLQRIFKSIYALSPKQYQLQARMEIAEDKLLSSDQTISEIAAELHFPSSQHFAAQFRRMRGMPPSQYRSENKER